MRSALMRRWSALSMLPTLSVRAACSLLALLVMLATSGTLCAHPLPGSAVLLDFQHDGVAAELQLPLDQLALALQQSGEGAGVDLAAPQQGSLVPYLLAHVHPVSADGRAWTVAVRSMAIAAAADGQPEELRAQLWMQPPPGAPVRSLTLHYDVMTHELMTHTVMVYARNDWDAGVFAGQPELLGTIRWVVKTIRIERADGSFWRGMASMLALGMRHIAEGSDHLLFLLTLLLPAPLLAGRHHWGAYGGARHTLGRLAAVVSAFTAGHSLTLILGAIGNVTLPQQPIEVLIAASIFFSAVHAWRPLLRGRETWIAAGFGLVHGLSFAQVIAGAGMDGWHRAAAVFGFNVGIELVQLIVVAAVAPWLMLLARAGVRAYTPLRLGGAAFAMLASLAWVDERLSGQENQITRLAAQLFEHAPLLVATLAVSSLLVAWGSKSAQRPAAMA